MDTLTTLKDAAERIRTLDTGLKMGAVVVCSPQFQRALRKYVEPRRIRGHTYDGVIVQVSEYLSGYQWAIIPASTLANPDFTTEMLLRHVIESDPEYKPPDPEGA